MRAESRCSRVGGRAIHRARYYNPYLCRFLNPDPAGFAGGLNHYAYANGNPVSYIDPFGLGAVGENNGSSWLNIPGMYQQMANFYAAENADTLGNAAGFALNFLQGVSQTLSPASGQGGNEPQAGAFLMALSFAFPELRGASALDATAARMATTEGLTTYDVSFGATGNGMLDTLGIQNARISNIGVTIDPSLTGANLANVTAHEGFHVAVAQTFPNVAASAGRLPYIGAFPLYAEEVGAYGYGAISAGQYGQALLAPISAFGSMSAGQTISVLGTGVGAGSLWYYGNH